MSWFMPVFLFLVLQIDVNDQQRENEGKTRRSSCATEEDRNKPTYCVTDVPPWYLCIFLAIQVGVMRFRFRLGIGY